MKNKGAVIALAIIITVLSLYQLSFTFSGRSVESDINEAVSSKLEALKHKNPDFKPEQLDSARNTIKALHEDSIRDLEIAWDGSTYDQVKEKELNLGLDLQGGMHITVVVDPAGMINTLAGRNSQKPIFKQAMEQAGKEISQSDLRLPDLFYQKFLDLNNGQKDKLNEYFLSTNNANWVSASTTDEEILKHINQELDDAIDRSIIVLRSRIDKFGATQPVINPVKATGRIEIELPGVDDKERIRRTITETAHLEFRDLAEPQQSFQLYQQIVQQFIKFEEARRGEDVEEGEKPSDANPGLFDGSEASSETLSSADSPEGDTNAVAANDSAKSEEGDELFADGTGAEEVDSAAQAQENQNKFAVVSEYLRPIQYANGQFDQYRFQSNIKYRQRIDAYMNSPEIKAILPPDVTFMWGTVDEEEEDPAKKQYVYTYFIKKGPNVSPILDGNVVVNAGIQSDPTHGEYVVTMAFNPDGTNVWARITEEYANANNKPIAIVLDDRVMSAPSVNQKIAGGRSQISGGWKDPRGPLDLANILKAGKLEVPLHIEQMIEVGPSLGQAAIDRGLMSLVVGLILVVLFMIMYYSKGGIISDIALLFNIFFILGILSTPAIGAALTLPGMAGIVLTIGMSIDANVLIFERIREEIKLGKSIDIAIKNGYDKAFWTIFDANATTLVTATILYSMGTGLIKGFAVTLMIGIACSFFSAVYITRLIIEFMARKNQAATKISFETGFSKKLFQNLNFNFIQNRKKAYLTSGAIIIVGVILMATQGLNLGVAFKGGRSYVIRFDEAVVPNEVKQNILPLLGESGAEVKKFDSDKQVAITTSFMIDDKSEEASKTVEATISKGLEKYANLNPDFVQSIIVEPSIAKDIKDASLKSIIVALICIFAYIIIRFRRWQFGTGALFALFHDVLIVLSIFAICRAIGFSFEIDEVFIAAILTIVGYSINDTVVVFDRVREYLRDNPRQALAETLNKSLNSTLSRTLMTSITTLLVVIVLLFAGGEALRGFSFALLIGVLVGTYSSVFIATPIVLDATNKGKQLSDKKAAQKKEETPAEAQPVA